MEKGDVAFDGMVHSILLAINVTSMPLLALVKYEHFFRIVLPGMTVSNGTLAILFPCLLANINQRYCISSTDSLGQSALHDRAQSLYFKSTDSSRFSATKSGLRYSHG